MRPNLRISIFVTVGLLLLSGALAPAAVWGQEDEWTEVQSLLNQGKVEEAMDAIRAKLAVDPENGIAWYMLASAHHGRGEYVEAAEANAKAAEFDATVRESAYYNRACALSLLGELEGAEVALSKAFDAGFADYDLLFSDPDLAALRDAGRLKVPSSRIYMPFKGKNGVLYGYTVLLPQGYDRAGSYPMVVAFGPGGAGIHSCDWALEHLWGREKHRKDVIVVIAHSPADGWISHPAHHALNDLLAELLAKYEVEGGKFHMVGYRGGSRIAATYASMSEQFFQSLTLFGGDPFVRWDDRNLGQYPEMPIHFVYGNNDEVAREAALRSRDRFREYGRTVRLTALPGEGPLMTSLWDAELLEQIAATIGMAAATPR